MKRATMRWIVRGTGLLVAVAAGTLLLGDYFSATASTFTPAPGAPVGRAPALAAVFWSGDMGLHVGFGSDLPEKLAARGIPVLAVSSPVVFGRERSAAFARDAVAESLSEALRRSGAQRLAVIGFSFGADLLGATLGELPADLRRRIAQVVIVGPATDVHFHANPFGLYYGGPSAVAPDSMARAFSGLSLSCIFARAEADSLCRAPLPGPVRLTAIDDNHLMLLHREEATAAVVDAVLRGLEPRR